MPFSETKERTCFLNSQGGFTFVELLMVMIVLGIVAQIAITIFVDLRRRGNDTKALAEGRNLMTVANINFVNLVDVVYTNDYTSPYGTTTLSGNIGTVDSDGNSRPPVYTLSEGVKAEIYGRSHPDPATAADPTKSSKIWAQLWHEKGSLVGGGHKKFIFAIDETGELYSLAEF